MTDSFNEINSLSIIFNDLVEVLFVVIVWCGR